MVTPVRCPVISDPSLGLADPAEFDPLLAHLSAAQDETTDEVQTFPRGTIQTDGRLDLCKQGVGPQLSGRIVAAAADSPLVRHLLLGTNGLGTEGVRAVADALRPGHHIETLYLGCNKIEADGAAVLADTLAADETLRALWLKRNPIGDEGVRRIATALSRNHHLRTLDLVNVGLSANGLAALAEVLADRPVKLERLFLGGNGLGPDAVPALGVIVRAGGVREMYLAANHLGDAGAAALADVCAGLPMTLGLGGNALTPAGAAALAARMDGWTALDLARPPSERALGATGNVVGDEGAYAFAEALPAARLSRLDLRLTEIRGRGALALLAAVEGHPTLRYLGINGGVPRRVRRAVAQLLADRPTDTPGDIKAIASIYR